MHQQTDQLQTSVGSWKDPTPAFRTIHFRLCLLPFHKKIETRLHSLSWCLLGIPCFVYRKNKRINYFNFHVLLAWSVRGMYGNSDLRFRLYLFSVSENATRFSVSGYESFMNPFPGAHWWLGTVKYRWF